MINKGELRDKLKYLTVVFEQLKQDEMVKKYFVWMDMDEVEKNILLKAWSAYYTQVWEESPAAQIYKVMRTATKEKAAELKGQTPTVAMFKKPSSVDPLWLERACPVVVMYRTIKDQIDQAKEALKRGGDDEMLAQSIFAA